MTKELEARIKAIEDKFVLPPNKMSTMRASSNLKDVLDDMKEGSESQEDVVWRVIGEAEKVPILFDKNAALENENDALKKQIAELKGGK